MDYEKHEDNLYKLTNGTLDAIRVAGHKIKDGLKDIEDQLLIHKTLRSGSIWSDEALIRLEVVKDMLHAMVDKLGMHREEVRDHITKGYEMHKKRIEDEKLQYQQAVMARGPVNA